MPDVQVELYRQQARRVLAEAQGIADPESQAALLEIAARYDWLAEWTQQQALGDGGA